MKQKKKGIIHYRREVVGELNRLFTREVRLTILSTILSMFVELIRQVIMYRLDNSEIRVKDALLYFQNNSLLVVNSLLSIVLLALIIWCITGVINKRKKDEKTSHLMNYIVAIMLTICCVWYFLQVLFTIDKTHNLISASIAVVMFFVLVMYFKDKVKRNEIFTDHYIAAITSHK